MEPKKELWTGGEIVFISSIIVTINIYIYLRDSNFTIALHCEGPFFHPSGDYEAYIYIFFWLEYACKRSIYIYLIFYYFLFERIGIC